MSALDKIRELLSYTVRGFGGTEGPPPTSDNQDVTNYIANLEMESEKPKEPSVTLQPPQRTPIESAATARPQTVAPGVELIKDYEKLKLSGYYATDHEREKGLVTAGYGSTGKVKFGEKVTEAQAEQWLNDHLREIDKSLEPLIKVDLTPGQYGAIRSLVYNVGVTQFAKSKALKALNRGDLSSFRHEAFGAEHGFVFQGDEILPGLVRRRKDEQALFDAHTPDLTNARSQGVSNSDPDS